MEEKEINTEQEKSSKLLSIIDLVKLVRRHLLFIAVTCLVVVGIGSVYVFSLPRSYTSRVVLAPELSSKTGGLGGNYHGTTVLAQTLRLFFGNGALHRLDGGAQLLRCGQKVLGILADLARKFFQFDSTFRHYFPPCAAYPA